MILKNLLVAAVALLHIGFLILEMFLWAQPLGLKIFAMKSEQAILTSTLAANQGLYNGFLAAGLIWSLLHPEPIFAKQLALFFLTCVTVAGLYGAYSVSWRILLVQAIPALIALVIVIIN